MRINQQIKNFLEELINKIENDELSDLDTQMSILTRAESLQKKITRFDLGQKVYYVNWTSITDYTMRIEEGYYFMSGGINGLGELATHFVSYTDKPLEAHAIVDDANIFATREEAEKRMAKLAAAHSSKTIAEGE